MKVLRIFGIWLIFVFAVLIMVLGFEFVNKTVSKSGFSSGKVFEIEEENGIITGEIFGRKIFADFSPAVSVMKISGYLKFLLPPYFRLILIGLSSLQL